MLTLPPTLQTVLQETDSTVVFSQLLPLLGEVLQCDRCFLYLRDPETGVGKVPYCWRRDPKFPEILDADWKPEPESLIAEDPLLAAGVRAEPSVYVEDVETAGSDVLNREFERQNFGHRALIHAHLLQDGQLWGVLQPCVFDHPRKWTETDRAIIETVTEKITPLAIAYVKANSK